MKQIRRRLPSAGNKWPLDEVVVTIAGKKHWRRQEALAQARSTGAGKKHWRRRAVDQNGAVLDILVQNRRDKDAAKRLPRKLLKKQCRAPCVMITV